ncbi:hypothetical protein PCANB_002681 [Pneumocystis canis]|nr:hypothetical protein PCANB_002681 [Pneumocystis canis]
MGFEDFSTKIQGYENLVVYCPICHNISVIPLHEKKFITVCCIPLIPYSWGKCGKGKLIKHQQSMYNPLENACYTFDNGLRRVVPYFFKYKTYAKERWRGRTIYDIFSTEFRDRTPQYYEQEIKNGRVMVNGSVATFEQKIKNGDIIEHISHRHEPPVTDKNIDIIYQDDDIVVINKPSGIPVHPAGRYRHNSIIHIMMAEMNFPSLARTLDRLTSGLMILARNVYIAEEMRKKMHGRRVIKEYLCKVYGLFPEGEVVCTEPLLTISPKFGLNRVHPDGKPSKSIFKRLSYDGKTSIVHCQPLTGRTHQLRVHLQWLGNPIVNDPIYANVKIWGENLGKNGTLVSSNDELFSSLMALGKTELAFHYTEEIEQAEMQRESRIGELLTGEVCNVCQVPLYSDPSQNELKIYLHAWRYKLDDHSWCFETELPEWANIDFLKI